MVTRVKIDNITNKGMYVDKENLVMINSDNILNLRVSNNIKVEKLANVIELFGKLNNLTPNAIIVYKYICIMKIVNKLDNTVTLYNDSIDNIAKISNLSTRSIVRAIHNLLKIGVLRRVIENGKVIDNNYIMNKDYDIINNIKITDDEIAIVIII